MNRQLHYPHHVSPGKKWPKSHQVPIFTEEDPTYDDLTETNSLASGSVNEILDGIADVQEFRDSILLDQHPFLDDLTIPDHIESSIEDISTIKRKPFFGQTRKKTPSESSQIHQSFDSPIHQSNMSLTESDFINQALTGGGRISRSSSSNQLGSIRTDSPKSDMMLPTAKETTVQPSSSFVMSKYNVKQTKAQVFDSSNYSVIKPNTQHTGRSDENSDFMLEEYLSKLNQFEEKHKIKPVSTPPPTSSSQGPLPQKRSESSDNVLTNEFMRVREEKFGKVLQDVDELEKQVEKENAKNLAKTAKMAQNQQKISSSSTVTTSSNSKWSTSNEEVSKFGSQAKTGSSAGNGNGKPEKLWTPANGGESPSLERRKAKDYKPVGFDGNSLQRSENQSEKEAKNIDPNESFAWKDSTLDRKLKELEERAKQQSALRSDDTNGFDKNIDKSIGNWSSLPKVTNPDVILLQKAREEKKVKKYLEDNYQHRTDLISPIPELKTNGDVPAESKKYQGTGPKTKEGNNSGYASEPETGRQSSYAKFASAESRGYRSGSSISEPPQFSKKESRFEREQRAKPVGSVSGYTPGAPNAVREEFSPPPGVSGAQKQYEQERFRVQPGRIEDYSLGRGSLAQKEAQQAHRAGCSITKYSSKHSFNPLASSKSEHNLSSQTYSAPQKFHLQSAIKDGYESDGALVFKRRESQNTPRSQTPAEAKTAYNQIQKGGDIPLDGLRMSLPDKQRESRAKYNEGEVNIHYKTPIRREEKEFIPEDELRKRQEDQMRKFYEDIEQKKEQELLQDMQNRKHHDTLLPTQKSPIPLNRYEELANGDPQSTTPQSTLNRNYKMVSRALYNFQAQNYRELSFKKGDLVYIRRQVDDNWYEGERNAMIGIFPVTYVEMIPNENVGSLSRKSSGGGTLPRGGSGSDQLTEGKGKAKFNFQAQTPMELSLIKGEIVVLTRRVDANWYEGRIGSRKGIFPSTYIEILQEPGETRGLSPTPIIKPVAAPAAHSILKNGSLPVPSYNPNYSVTSPYSTINSRPGSSMSQTTVTQQQMTTSNSFHMECKNEPVPFRALYNYKPQNDDEVELNEGDVVYVMERCDDGWFVGTSQRTGIFGTFPGNYVAKA